MSSYIPLVVLNGNTEEEKPYSGIAILLPETLCQIFAMLLRDTYGKTLEYGYQVTMRYNFAQVCREWREIALAEPTLWRYLDFRGTRWTKLLVQRSKAANLHVNASACRATMIRKGVPDERFKSMLSVLPSNLWRLEELMLEYLPLAQTVQLLSGPEDNTPYPLRHLDLITTMPARANDQDAVNSFIRKCHNLQSLRLAGLKMYKWNTPLPSCLTDLDLSGQARPSTKEFLTTLSGLPGLQVLCLQGGPIATEDDPPFASPYTINLPFLQHLSLIDVNTATESYYRYLNIPPTAHIEIACQITPAQPSPQPVLEYLIERFQDQDLPWPTLRRAHLLHYRGTFEITLLPTVPEAKEVDFENPCFTNLWKECFDATSGLTTKKFVCIRFEWHDGKTSWGSAFPEDVCASFFTQIHQGLPLHHLQSLFLMSITDLLPSEGMDELVTGLPQLVLLGVHAPGKSWWSCLIRNENRALDNSKSDPELNQKPSSLLPLPKLSRLVIMLDKDMTKKENESVILQAYEWISLRTRSSGKLRALEFNFFTERVPPPTVLYKFKQFADVFIIPTV